MPNTVNLVLAFLFLLLLLFFIRREREEKLTLTAVSLFSVWSRIGGQDGASSVSSFFHFSSLSLAFLETLIFNSQSLLKRDSIRDLSIANCRVS